MLVLLTRHGQAVPEGPSLPDDYRYLSEHGRRQVAAVGELLRSHGWKPDAIITSPLTRAVQTAELLAAATQSSVPVEVEVGLCPGAYPQLATRTIASLQGTVLVVSHMPTISQLGAHLVGKPSFPPFKPGQVSLLRDGRPDSKIDPERLEIEPLLLA